MFFLIVFVEFKNKEDMNLFITNFEILQNYCLINESDFLIQYEYAYSDKVDNKIIIFEKYLNKNSYLNIHKKSKEFLHFKNLISKIDCNIYGESFFN